MDDRTLAVALTLDVDPDANRAVAGRPDAVGPDGTARFEACRRGLGIVAEVAARRAVPLTLFWEGRALREIARAEPELVRRLAEDPKFEHGCHGYRHEDFAGVHSGRAMSQAEIGGALDEAEAAFREVLGRRPTAFRAPYCNMTPALAEALAERDYAWDSSLTVNAPGESDLHPFRLPDARSLWELPLCRARDAGGRAISGYLWQLCEGNRPASDYVQMVRALRAPCAGGLCQIALHPWHLLVTAEGAPLRATGRDSPAAGLEAVLDGVAAIDGVRFTTPGAFLGCARRK